MVGIKKDQSVTIDLTSQQLVVRTLTEAKITCGEEDKVQCVCIAGRVLFVDLWLLLWVVCVSGVCAWLYNGLPLECCVHVMLPYIPLSSLSPPLLPFPQDLYLLYFLSTYPGRTLVFVNTIDHLKQLQSLLNLLGCQPNCLHAGMQQRQRLKNLER